MAQTYTTTDLIASVKTKGLIPTSQSTFQDEDFLRFGTEEIQVSLLPTLLSVREEFFVTYADQQITANQEGYDIPDRAVGRALRDVLYVNGNPGQITGSTEVQSLARLEPDQLPWQQNVARSTNDFMFYPRDDKIILSPQPRTTHGTLRLVYHRRPSNLVKVSATAKITQVNSSTEVVVDQVPTTFNTTTATYDVIEPTGGFTSLGDDFSISTIASTTLTLQVPNDKLYAGCYISLAGKTPIPQLPLEYQSVLAQRIVVKCLEALGDVNGVQVAQAKLNEIEQAAMALITPRVRGEARKIMSVNYYKNSYWG